MSRRHPPWGFLLAVGLFVPAAWLGFRDEVLGAPLLALRAGTAEAVAALLRLAGVDAVRHATAVVHSTGFGIEISRGCTGVVGAALLAVGVAAYPAEVRRRIVGLAVIPAAFLAINLLRLVHLYGLGAHGSAAFHGAHAVWWQVGMVAVGLALWCGWLLCVGRRGRGEW